MTNLWFDLTDLYNWSGHFTGIQRVTYNYTSRFAKEGARFFIYSELYDRFIEIPFSLAEQPTTVPKRKLLKKKLKTHYKKLPVWLRTISSPLLHFANNIFRKFAAMLLDRNGRDHVLRKLPTANFTEQDTVVLLDASWNSKNFIDRLTDKKKVCGFRVILHINDILPIYQPQLFAEELPEIFSSFIYKALRISDLVIAISNATKQDVIKFCKEHRLDPVPIKIIRLGENIANASPQKPKEKIAQDFILCVGTFEIRKNYILLYQAVKLAQEEGIKLPQIVIAGRRGWLTQDLQYVIEKDPSVANKLMIVDKMSDSNLSWLYENCLFTVFCSVAEGWGLPIAESLQHGKLCVSSNTSSMPEIANGLIDYFSPFDPRACLRVILRYLEKDEYIKKNAQIKKTYQPYTWENSFKQYQKIISLAAR